MARDIPSRMLIDQRGTVRTCSACGKKLDSAWDEKLRTLGICSWCWERGRRPNERVSEHGN